MPRLSRKGLVAASISVLVLASTAASAQPTTAPTSTTTVGPALPCVASPLGQPTVTASPQQTAPNRLVRGVNLGTSTRPPSLNPNGVSYQDCIDNMVLQFPVTACNFSGQNLQIWASRSSNCQNPTDRGIGANSVCWLVSSGDTGLVLSQGGKNYSLRVQDIVGPENLNPSPTTMTSYGVEACTVQATFLAVPINLNFIPINPGDGTTAGTPYQYQLTTDLVGPPPPKGVSIADGDTLFVVNWTPNVDTDTGGYNVVIDPIPGHEPADATTAFAAPTGATTVLVCPAEAGMSTVDGTATTAAEDASDGEVADVASADVASADAADGESTDGAPVDASDAMASMPVFDAAPPVSDAASIALDDAGCYLQQVAGSGASGSGNGGTCNDPLLSGGTRTDGGTDAEVAAPVELDEAGNPIVSDSGVSTPTTGGGIWMPPAGHIVNPNPTLGITATGETISTYTVTGLRNGITYNVVVAAVDNFGNIGPPSTQVCDFPAPVNDFWKIYRTDGGQAGGGFCALEAVGAPAASTVAFAGAGALVVAGLRRRRRRRQ